MDFFTLLCILDEDKMNTAEIVTISKDIATIVFYVVGGIIAVLTYRQAKKTLFQPIKTEIFKKQVDLFNDLYGIFGGKQEAQLLEDAGYRTLIAANAQKMYDDFGQLFYDIVVNPDERYYSVRLCPTGRVKYDLKKNDNLQFPTGHVEPPAANQAVDPNIKAALWQAYSHKMLSVPLQYSQLEDRLKILHDSPLMPSALRSLIQEYMKINKENLEILRSTLIEVSRELPTKYPNRDAFANSEFYWVSNIYNRKSQKLQPVSEKITAFLNGYYNVEKLLQ